MTHNHMYVISWPFIFFYFQVMIYFPIQVGSSERVRTPMKRFMKIQNTVKLLQYVMRSDLVCIAQGTPTSGHLE